CEPSALVGLAIVHGRRSTAGMPLASLWKRRGIFAPRSSLFPCAGAGRGSGWRWRRHQPEPATRTSSPCTTGMAPSVLSRIPVVRSGRASVTLRALLIVIRLVAVAAVARTVASVAERSVERDVEHRAESKIQVRPRRGQDVSHLRTRGGEDIE